MRLVAIYIKQHDYLFDKPQMINFGGKYFYEFNLNKKGKFDVKKVRNQSFIENFWGDNISLVSTIVGENGAGKTSILKELVMSFDRFREGTSFNNIAFIYEINDDDFIIDTKLDLIDEKLKGDFSKVRIEYYNPVLDYDLQDISGYINPSNIFNNTLEEYHLNILKYQVLFNYSSVSDSLKKIYKSDFPKFGSVLLRAKLHYKQDFEKIFALSNLQEGMRRYLEKVFDKYPNFDERNNQFLHNQDNFIKNIEVTILSILVINNLYNVSSGSGISKYTIDEMLEGEDFLEILEKFKKQYILLNSTKEVLKSYEENKYLDFRRYLYNHSYFKYPNQHKNILRILRMFNAFEHFYKRLLKLSREEGFNEYDNNLFFSNDDNNQNRTDNMVRFITIYNRLLIQLNMLHVKNPSLIEFSFFEMSVNKRLILSNGEKALLNLYSIVYNFGINSQIKTHQWRNFIFLLDEADLGFHPEWKKRFVSSVIRVFPEILNRIKHLGSIQVIFTTHDPLTLSDIPNNNVVYLKKKYDKTDVLKNSERPQKSFGGNITDLLSDSFFINDGLIGDFAKEKIQTTLEWLKKEANKGEVAFVLDDKIKLPSFNSRDDEKAYHRLIIDLIDEPLVKNKLKSMYLEFVKDDDKFKYEEIERLREEIKKLESR